MNTPVYSLYNNLLDGYNSDIRPAKNQSLTTNVEINLSIMQIIAMVLRNTVNLANFWRTRDIQKYDRIRTVPLPVLLLN